MLDEFLNLRVIDRLELLLVKKIFYLGLVPHEREAVAIERELTHVKAAVIDLHRLELDLADHTAAYVIRTECFINELLARIYRIGNVHCHGLGFGVVECRDWHDGLDSK